MADNKSPDPGAFFREMLGQWESMANEFGSGLMRTGEFSRAMHGATAATMQAKEATREVMSRALAAANMPSREEVIDLSARMQAVEDRLASIEQLLVKIAGVSAPPAETPSPKRTKTPPAA